MTWSLLRAGYFSLTGDRNANLPAELDGAHSKKGIRRRSVERVACGQVSKGEGEDDPTRPDRNTMARSTILVSKV